MLTERYGLSIDDALIVAAAFGWLQDLYSENMPDAQVNERHLMARKPTKPKAMASMVGAPLDRAAS
jgi:predicted nucleic acid-binding protein